MKKKVVATPIKVSTKKVVAKKAVVKKVAATPKKSAGKAPLMIATNAQSFWVNNGQILNSLKALETALMNMSKDTFSYHVAKDRNDFAQWVEYILLDVKCAAELRKAKTVAATKTVVKKYLKNYQF